MANPDMTTRSNPYPATRHPLRLSTLVRLTHVEGKLAIRDVAYVFFALLFPGLLLTILASVMPGFTDPSPDFGGLRAVDIYTPVVLGVTMATVAFSILPATLATYREQGVLRRFRVTPVPPSALLTAQLVVNLVAVVIGSLIAVTAATTLFSVALPTNPAGALIGFVLGTTASFAAALIIAAVAPNPRVASAIGMLTYFPMLFFAGVWLPGDAMPETARRIADFTPVGAGVEAISVSWEGNWPSVLHLAVLAGWTIVAGAIAARFFRWE